MIGTAEMESASSLKATALGAPSSTFANPLHMIANAVYARDTSAAALAGASRLISLSKLRGVTKNDTTTAIANCLLAHHAPSLPCASAATALVYESPMMIKYATHDPNR